MRHLRPERAAVVGAQLGEGPAWDAHRGELTFVDIVAGRLYRLGPDGRPEVLLEIDGALGAALPATGGGRLLVTRTGFAATTSSGPVRTVLDVLSARPDLRFNDAKCDPAGRCFAGTLSLTGAAAAGTLYRLDDGPVATAVVRRVGLSNGLGWSPDGRLLYFVDTASGQVSALDYDLPTGVVGSGRVLLAVDPGTPDGLCVDDAGGVWVAFWGLGTVRRYTPGGLLDTVVDMPTPNPTSCAFGGPDGDVLFITTASGGEPAPLAGDLFALRPGVTGPAAVPWRGVRTPPR